MKFIVIKIRSELPRTGFRDWTTKWLRSSGDQDENCGVWHLTGNENEAFAFDDYSAALDAVKWMEDHYLVIIPLAPVNYPLYHR